ncbi:MAG TPA: hypothetical protein ENK00_03180, partial [Chromatiales bacterium]|nr:hypothetical protein [Chromatiales bacterium]
MSVPSCRPWARATAPIASCRPCDAVCWASFRRTEPASRPAPILPAVAAWPPAAAAVAPACAAPGCRPAPAAPAR